jgi:nucleoside 2-deoxyribosyltransferase
MGAPRLYLAAGLFSPFDRQRNSTVAKGLIELGYHVFLPQDIRTQTGERPSASTIFRECVSQLDQSDVIVGLVDGADVDSGTAWEIGYAYARQKPIVVLRTDYRSAEHGPVNIMIEFSARLVLANATGARVLDAIQALIEAIDRTIPSS